MAVIELYRIHREHVEYCNFDIFNVILFLE
jgi:hypothetical protein